MVEFFRRNWFSQIENFNKRNSSSVLCYSNLINGELGACLMLMSEQSQIGTKDQIRFTNSLITLELNFCQKYWLKDFNWFPYVLCIVLYLFSPYFFTAYCISFWSSSWAVVHFVWIEFGVVLSYRLQPI